MEKPPGVDAPSGDDLNGNGCEPDPEQDQLGKDKRNTPPTIVSGEVGHKAGKSTGS
jgi:hypothetical protein